jgi:hypothetical protein
MEHLRGLKRFRRDSTKYIGVSVTSAIHLTAAAAVFVIFDP